MMQQVSGGTSAWSVANPTYTDVFSVAAQDINPSGLYFKPDGAKMYVVDNDGEDISEYDLGVAWSVSTASFVQSFNVTAQDLSPLGIFFKPDGTKFYIAGSVGDAINEYDLSTAWDISTASYTQNATLVGSVSRPYFRADGTRAYFVRSFDRAVREYSLGTAWDISTIAHAQDFTVYPPQLTPRAVFFKPDGTKMFVSGVSGRYVTEYNLGVAWDISTSMHIRNFSAVQTSSPRGLFFKSDGTKMYILDATSDSVYEYDL